MQKLSSDPDWAHHAISELRAGRTVQLQAFGNSMRPHILSGSTMTLVPVSSAAAVAVEDVVLVDVPGRTTLHKVVQLDATRVLIGDEHGHLDGWVDLAAVHGVVTNVLPPS